MSKITYIEELIDRLIEVYQEEIEEHKKYEGTIHNVRVIILERVVKDLKKLKGVSDGADKQ